jgi:hypothetical protein
VARISGSVENHFIFGGEDYFKEDFPFIVHRKGILALKGVND